MNSVYIVNVPKEYIGFIDDATRIFILQVTIQFLYFINSPDTVSFFSGDFALLVIYMLLGLALYHLVFDRLVSFR